MQYNKYRNKKVIIDGIKFDSKKEGDRYKELKQMEAQGIITGLSLQKTYELQPKYKLNDKSVRSITYKADFTYQRNGETIVEDVKGMKTDVYKIKKKLFEFKYKTEIREI